MSASVRNVVTRKPENYRANEKYCKNCDAWKALAEFRLREGGYYETHCRTCEALLERKRKKSLDPDIGTRKVGRKPMEIENNRRTCTECDEEKDISEFTAVAPSKLKEGCMPVQGRCRPCYLESRRQYRLENLEKAKLVDRKQALKRYGLTIETYDALHEAQQGLCAICGQPEKALSHDRSRIKLLAVDHCHQEGRIRGLLCQDCNTALGLFRDDIERLLSAAEYLAGSVNSVGTAS